MAGIPGVNAWKVKVNGSFSDELLIPPSIAGSKAMFPQQPIIVKEGDHVRMRCAVTGHPKPNVEWRKYDGSTIPMGAWKAISVAGHTLNITKINRAHMGVYMCIADNGIPPSANETFFLEVHFPPMIRIHKQVIGVTNGSTATLECEVEAYPEPVRYWERVDGRQLDHGWKYRVNDTEAGRFRSLMQLNITNIGPNDMGLYHCVVKNEINIAKGIFTVHEVDPHLATPPPINLGGPDVKIYGFPIPELVDEEDLCPPQFCPDCPDVRSPIGCRAGGMSLVDLVTRLEIKPFSNLSLPGLPNRTLDCVLYAVGKPVFHKYTEEAYGSWMKEPAPRNDAVADMIWTTKENDHVNLYEYANKAYYRKNNHTRRILLKYPYRGNCHVIYNGSFFYHEKDKPFIVKLELMTGIITRLEVPGVNVSNSNFLYTTEYNYLDFSVDDNGLWVIYGLPSNNNTVVMKVDAASFTKQYMWNISVNHHKVGEMFIACGVLYAVDSVVDRSAKIRFALDLFKNYILDVNLSFTNPFRRTTMITYNHRTKELFTWDKGNQLTYPVRYHEIGYNMTKEDKGDPEVGARVQTGFELSYTLSISD